MTRARDLADSADLNFDNGTLVVDQTNNRVGVGTAAPATPLHVLGAANVVTLAGSNATTSYSTFQYNTSTISGYVGNGSGILSGASSSDFIMRSEGNLAFASNGNNRTMTLDTSGNVGIGTAPESFAKLEVKTSTDKNIAIFDNAAAPTIGAITDAGSSQALRFAGQNIIMTGAGGSGAEHMRIDSSGNVTIQPAGTTTRSFGETVAVKVDQGAPTRLSVRNDSVNATASSGITMSGAGNSWAVECGSSAKNGNALTFAVDATAGTPSVKMRLNTDGRWWVGQAVGTTLGGNGGEAVTGIMHASSATDSYTVIQANGSNSPLYVTRGPNATGNGFIHFGENGAYAGGIGNVGGRIFFADNTQNMGISFYQSSLLPTNINGTAVDNVYDCGHSSYRWDDVWATNGTIQTSDANEKQQIAALTDVEMTAAKAISQLFKTYKWNSAVEAKGDAARTHTGVIAQDVQAAMTAAGLDAGDYAFFISSTWWETQTEVPAVEAVDAVDAVYEDVVIPAVEEELDEDGNVIVEAQPERTEHRLVSEAIRAVEAVAAYTRTDVYDTAEEAPEGATERTRMGIRYPELLSFIGAATEQRLTTIEARIAALEAN